MLGDILCRKCPNCKKRGIIAFGIMGRSGYKSTCKFCQKKYTVNSVLVIFTNFSLVVFFGTALHFVDNYIGEIPLWVWMIFFFIVYGVLQYCIPLEEVDQ